MSKSVSRECQSVRVTRGGRSLNGICADGSKLTTSLNGLHKPRTQSRGATDTRIHLLTPYNTYKYVNSI
jgi:hypothetical protein